jgi:hypothetical protein
LYVTQAAIESLSSAGTATATTSTITTTTTTTSSTAGAPVASASRSASIPSIADGTAIATDLFCFDIRTNPDGAHAGLVISFRCKDARKFMA